MWTSFLAAWLAEAPIHFDAEVPCSADLVHTNSTPLSVQNDASNCNNRVVDLSIFLKYNLGHRNSVCYFLYFYDMSPLCFDTVRSQFYIIEVPLQAVVIPS